MSKYSKIGSSRFSLKENPLLKFIIIRIIMVLPLLWFLLTLLFILLRVLPGANPVEVLNPQIPPEHAQRITEQLGLNKPLKDQYFDFLRSTVHLDFGDSYRTNASVNDELKLKFGATLMLAIFSMFIGVPVGIFMGAWAGAKREKTVDHSIRIFTIGVYATPIFLVGIILQRYLGRGGEFPIFPPLGLLSPGDTENFTHYTEIWILDSMLSLRFDITLDILLHLFLPSLALGLLISSSIARQIRTNMIHELQQEYVQFARARGISERTIVQKYALKNAIVPVISLISLQFALLLSGAILTETVFNIPGLGRYLFQSIEGKDFPAIQGAFVYFMIIVSFVSLIGDVLHAIVDPRVKY